MRCVYQSALSLPPPASCWLIVEADTIPWERCVVSLFSMATEGRTERRVCLVSVLPYLSAYLDYRDCHHLMFLSKLLYSAIHQFHSLRFLNHSSSFLSLRHLPSLFPSLTSLHLSHSPSPSSSPSHHQPLAYEDLHQFLLRLPILNLSLTGYEISPPLSLSLPPPLPSMNLSPPLRPLKKLSLSDVLCSPQVLSLCCCHSSSLQELTITSSASIHDKLLCKLLTMLPALTRLSLHLCYEVTHLFFSPPLSISPIRHLNLSKCSRLQSIHSLTSLLSCDVSYTSITSSNLEIITQENRSLKELHAAACPQISSLVISSCSLVKLNLQKNPFFKSLILCSPSLSELILTDCYQLSQLDLYANRLQRLDLKMLVSLSSFHLTSSALSSLDLTGCLPLSNSLQYLFQTATSPSSPSSSSCLSTLSGNMEVRRRRMTAHDDDDERDHHISYHPPWGPLIHSTPPSPAARKEFEPRVIPFSADAKLSHRPPPYYEQRHSCCLCGHFASSCQTPPLRLHHSETITTELDSNLELIIHSKQLFRPTYRCFHHVNFSLCCPSLELRNIVFPGDRATQREEVEGSQGERKRDQSSRSSTKMRKGGNGEDPQRKRAPGKEEEDLFLKMERRLTM